jgi:hypothetical protein
LELPSQGIDHELLPAHLGQGGLGIEANPHAVTSLAPGLADRLSIELASLLCGKARGKKKGTTKTRRTQRKMKVRGGNLARKDAKASLRVRGFARDYSGEVLRLSIPYLPSSLFFLLFVSLWLDS